MIEISASGGSGLQRLSRRNLLQLVLGTGAGAGFGMSRAAEVAGRRDTAVIQLWLGGGPSHLDMYDLKPDAPSEYRGEFRGIATNVPGLQICELMPRQAARMDRLAVIRSLRTTTSDHPRARTGCRPAVLGRRDPIFDRLTPRPAPWPLACAVRDGRGCPVRAHCAGRPIPLLPDGTAIREIV